MIPSTQQPVTRQERQKAITGRPLQRTTFTTGRPLQTTTLLQEEDPYNRSTTSIHKTSSNGEVALQVIKNENAVLASACFHLVQPWDQSGDEGCMNMIDCLVGCNTLWSDRGNRTEEPVTFILYHDDGRRILWPALTEDHPGCLCLHLS